MIAIIAILASLLLPALSSAKGRANTASCLNNKRQLLMAWKLYAEDNNDLLLENSAGRVEVETWVPEHAWSANWWTYGRITWALDSSNTNVTAMMDPRACRLAPYTARNVDVYRCTEDKYLSPIQRQAGWRFRIRSVDMNYHVGGGYIDDRRKGRGSVLKIFEQSSDFSDPAAIYVILDEHPDTLDAPMFWGPSYEVLWERRTVTAWSTLPSSLHNGGGTFGFADSHAELKKWRDPTTKLPVSFIGRGGDMWNIPISTEPGSDIVWVALHATEIK